jgi:hypothetical protein
MKLPLLQTSGGGIASLTWDQIESAAANLTLNNAGYTTTFNQTSPVVWDWANTTAATSSSANNSPILTLTGSYFGVPTTSTNALAASTPDSWSLQEVIATPATLSGTTAITTFVETSFVVTLTVAAQTIFTQAGIWITLSGFPTGAGSWLNGYTVFITSALGGPNSTTSLSFVDPTQHANVTSTALTGTPVITQASGMSQLQLVNSGAGGGIVLANNTPTITGTASAGVAISTTTTPTNPSGNTWQYTFAATQPNAPSWVGQYVTIAGYTSTAAGNNGTFLVTAATTAHFQVINPTGTTSGASGIPGVISTAVVNSPSITLSGTCGSGVSGASEADSWSFQTGTVTPNNLNAAPSGPNPKSALIITHKGSTGGSWLVVPQGITAAVGQTLTLDTNNNGGGVAFTMQAGTFQQGSISWGAGGGNVIFGMSTASANHGMPIFLQGYSSTDANSSCITLTNNSTLAAMTPTSGTNVGLDIGNGAAVGGLGTFTFKPVAGTATFVAAQVAATINQAINSSSPTSYSLTSNVATFVLPTMAAAFSSAGSVTISGATGGNAFLNGTWTVNGTPTTTQLKLNITNGNVSSTALSGVTAAQQATGNFTALKVNPTLTAVGGTALLLDLQVSGTSKFSVNSAGHIINGVADSQGSVTSSSGTTVSYSYATAYNSTPTVTVTPVTNAGAFYLSSSTNTGFTITYANSGVQTFNYMVEGNPN